MGRIKDALVAYVEARGWPYTEDGDRLAFPGFGEHGAWTVFVNAIEDDEQILVHSLLQEDVPAHRRPELAIFLTRANFGLVLGNFELDLQDGELRYKTSVDVEGVEITDTLLDNLVLSNVAMVDRYLPGIRAVAAGEDAATAVRAAEAG